MRISQKVLDKLVGKQVGVVVRHELDGARPIIWARSVCGCRARSRGVEKVRDEHADRSVGPVSAKAGEAEGDKEFPLSR